jgi:hypothetical protein
MLKVRTSLVGSGVASIGTGHTFRMLSPSMKNPSFSWGIRPELMRFIIVQAISRAWGTGWEGESSFNYWTTGITGSWFLPRILKAFQMYFDGMALLRGKILRVEPRF